MLDFIKQNMASLGIKDESEIDENEIPVFSVEEEYDYIYDINSGYIVQGLYRKRTTLNNDYKVTTYEYRLKD